MSGDFLCPALLLSPPRCCSSFFYPLSFYLRLFLPVFLTYYFIPLPDGFFFSAGFIFVFFGGWVALSLWKVFSALILNVFLAIFIGWIPSTSYLFGKVSSFIINFRAFFCFFTSMGMFSFRGPWIFVGNFSRGSKGCYWNCLSYFFYSSFWVRGLICLFIFLLNWNIIFVFGTKLLLVVLAAVLVYILLFPREFWPYGV